MPHSFRDTESGWGHKGHRPQGELYQPSKPHNNIFGSFHFLYIMNACARAVFNAKPIKTIINGWMDVLLFLL